MAQSQAYLFSNRYDATENTGFSFPKTIFVWHGSIFKLIWLQTLAYIIAFSGLNALYRFVFMHDEKMKESFELVCIYCSRFSSKVPVTFIIGFYVSTVVSRYWDQFISLPWPDRIALKLVAFIPGQDEYSRRLRRTIMRYINLSTVLVFRIVSPKVRTRFPNYASLVKAGLMLPGEDLKLSTIDSRTPHETSWVPMLWIASLLQKERLEGRLKIESNIYSNIINSFEYLENCNRRIFNHGWVNFPFAYSQVISLTVYSYLFANLFGQQFLEPNDASKSDIFKELGVSLSNSKPYDVHTPFVYVPVFTLIEFIAYLGWIKVAETLLNPWGDDDEDFQVNYLIDRNFQTSLLIVDEAISDIQLTPDSFESSPVPSELPYNKKLGKSKVLGLSIFKAGGPSIFSSFQSHFSVSTATLLAKLNLSTKEPVKPKPMSGESNKKSPVIEYNLESPTKN